jgi:hypothetical protein
VPCCTHTRHQPPLSHPPSPSKGADPPNHHPHPPTHKQPHTATHSHTTHREVGAYGGANDACALGQAREEGLVAAVAHQHGDRLHARTHTHTRGQVVCEQRGRPGVGCGAPERVALRVCAGSHAHSLPCSTDLCALEGPLQLRLDAFQLGLATARDRPPDRTHTRTHAHISRVLACLPSGRPGFHTCIQTCMQSYTYTRPEPCFVAGMVRMLACHP